ncbi:MAG: T9SS type A sorting domain-containing protein [Bacteroidia bacterium]|nr:T9SS type A sorting domain-containing protein [Bacteroidia bacterium]
MKKLFVLLLSAAFVQPIAAKKVKFSVDMSKQTVSPNGVHIAGDFQDEAGYPNGDWQSNTTTLTLEPGTNIYSITLNIPAHRKYEYKFVNGDQFYEAEFVPELSRADFEFSDNRWIYLDSTNDEVFYQGAILFAENAPLGKMMVRLKVDVKKVSSINAEGIFLAGSFNSFKTTGYKMTHFDTSNSVHEILFFTDSGNHQYRFCNGRDTLAMETVPEACASNGNRTLTATYDTSYSLVCFSSCTVCLGTGNGEKDNFSKNEITLFPNPCQTNLHIKMDGNQTLQGIEALDVQGRTIYQNGEISNPSFAEINTQGWTKGFYFIKLTTSIGEISLHKIRVD